MGFWIISREESPVSHHFLHFPSLGLIGTDMTSWIYVRWKHQAWVAKNKQLLEIPLCLRGFSHLLSSREPLWFNSCSFGCFWHFFLWACKQKAAQLQWGLFGAVRVLADYTGDRGAYIFGLTNKAKKKKWAAIYSKVIWARIQTFQGFRLVFWSENRQLVRAKQSMMTAANEKKVLQE